MRRTRKGAETRHGKTHMYRCNQCLTWKINTEFYVKDRATNRLDTTCKPCRIILHRIKNLGVTNEEYHDMLISQKSKCGVCKKRLYSRRYKAFAVDHCRKTGAIRGLLCTKCNTAIGLLEDNVEVMQRAIDWVKGIVRHS